MRKSASLKHRGYEFVGEQPEEVDVVTAEPTASRILLDDVEVSLQAYNIGGNNYFKLRDLGMLLKDTEKSFSVNWDEANNAIALDPGKPYVAVGGELAAVDHLAPMEATLSSSAVYLSGEAVELTAYNINGNNYFKLRDLARAINFGVTWDGTTNTLGIDSSADYVEE